MENCFRKKGVFAVRFLEEIEKKQLLDTAEALGIPVPRGFRVAGRYAWPQDTCTFAVNLRQKKLEYMAPPFLCAAMANSGVRFYSVPEFCRLAELGFPRRTRCPVFHVAHDGNEFPPELMSAVCIPEERFLSYHNKMRDTGVWEMAPREYRVPFQAERFKISRLLCDVERFIGPEEVMERYGMGFCYERAFDGTRIKNVTDELRERTLCYYHAHHARMDEICRKHRKTVLFDLHSYSDEIVPEDFLRDGIETPDVCIGTDTRFTPPQLVQITRDHFEKAGYSTALNYPYEGCYVPNAVLTGSRDCVSIMLELNRRVYSDDRGLLIARKLEEIRKIIRQITAECVTLG